MRGRRVNKTKALEALRKSVDSDIKGAMASIEDQQPIQVLSTGILTVDHSLGVGGLARGAIHMVYGRPGSGKTAFCLMAIADKMRRDPDAVVAWLDVERTLRKEWVEAFGIDPARLQMLYPSTTEETVNLFQDVIRAGFFDYVVVDSLGAVARSVEVDGNGKKDADANTVTFGGSSALISRMVRVGNAELTRLYREVSTGVDKIEPVVVLINQVRADVGSAYAGALTFTGGYALEHMMSSIIRVQASGSKTDILMGTDTTGKLVKVGSLVNATTEKNKLAPSPRLASYFFCYQDCEEHKFGVDTMRAIIDLSVVYGFLRQSGAWYYYGEEKMNGMAACIEWLKERPEVQDELRLQVLAIVRKELVDTRIVDEAVK
jgi:recombination protein RecA